MQDDYVEIRNPQDEVLSLSTFNDNESESDITSSEDEFSPEFSPLPSRTSRNKSRISPSPRLHHSPTPERSMSRHRYLTHIKRCASAPCRVPLQRQFPRRVSLAYRRDESRTQSRTQSDNENSESESSLPSPYMQGPNMYGEIPNPMEEFEGTPDEQAKHRALQSRVDNLRALKLNGTIINYETYRRRGKSIVERLMKEPDVLKLYLKGYSDNKGGGGGDGEEVVGVGKRSDKAKRVDMTADKKYADIPFNLVSIIQRITPGRELYKLLEDEMHKAFSEDTVAPWSNSITGIGVDCYYVTEMEHSNVPSCTLTFTIPPSSPKDLSAFVRIWLHSLCHFHGVRGKSVKGKGGKGGKFVIKGKLGEIKGRLMDEVNRRNEL